MAITIELIITDLAEPSLYMINPTTGPARSDAIGIDNRISEVTIAFFPKPTGLGLLASIGMV